MICKDFLMPVLSNPSLSDYYNLQQFALGVTTAFTDIITTVNLTVSSDKTKITYCYEIINDSKAWLALWLSVAQFALFHFVMFSMSRIFLLGL